MSKTTVSLEVEAATYALGTALGKCVTDIVSAMKAGGGTLPETTAIATAILLDLAPALADFNQIPSDAKDSLPDFIAAWLASGLNLWKGIQS